jgi:hypothetical protein
MGTSAQRCQQCSHAHHLDLQPLHSLLSFAAVCLCSIDAAVESQDAEAGSSPAQWRVVWLERENGGAGFSGNWAGFSKDQVQLHIRPYFQPAFGCYLKHGLDNRVRRVQIAVKLAHNYLLQACSMYHIVMPVRSDYAGSYRAATPLHILSDVPWHSRPTASCTLQLLNCGDVVLWEVLDPNHFRVHLFRAGLHETDAALRATLPGGARCGPFYAGERYRLLVTPFGACAIGSHRYALPITEPERSCGHTADQRTATWLQWHWREPCGLVLWPITSRNANTEKTRHAAAAPEANLPAKTQLEAVVLHAAAPRSEQLEAHPSSDAGSPRSSGSMPAGALHSLSHLTCYIVAARTTHAMLLTALHCPTFHPHESSHG